MTQLALVETPPAPTVEVAADFDSFWTLYPRHVAKKDAKRAWEKLSPDQRVEAIVALVSWRRVWLKRGEMEFVPHPATWLNGERWEDELPAATAAGPTHASHVIAEPGKVFTKTEMPAHVLDAIRKLRAPR